MHFPLVHLTTDRIRGAAAPQCTGVVRQDILNTDESAACALASAWQRQAEDIWVAGFAALLHRYSGRHRIDLHVEWETGADASVRFTASPESTLRTLTAGALIERSALPERAPMSVRFGPPRGLDTDRPYSLQLQLWPASLTNTQLELHYDESLFDADSAQQLLAHYVVLLRSGLTAPEQPLAQLRLCEDDELRRMLVDWNATETPLPLADVCLHEAFEEQVTRSHDSIAVIHGATRLTYAQVNRAANRLAHHLTSLGVGPEVRVGLYLDHSPELLISMLGVLKAGGAYVPLDPGHPPYRVMTMMDSSSCTAFISMSDLVTALGDTPPHIRPVLLDDEADVLTTRPGHNPETDVRPDNLCYVMHTSGSTGAPKPIALCHRGVVNNIADLNSRFGVGADDKVIALSSPGFDMSVYEFMGITAAGGTVVVPSPSRRKDPAHWTELLTDHGITVWNSAPALLELALERIERSEGTTPPLSDLRLVMLAGDWISLELPGRLRKIAPSHRFISLGGATEASIYSTLFEVEAPNPAWKSIPYGRPMANQRTYILDGALQPVPPGVPGELYLAGAGLAREYLDQPALTAERFLDWSYAELVGDRVYRTGDLARFGRDGLIELLGRTDLQVKVHGLRIEPAEIEAVLREHPAVKDSAVTAQPDATGTPTLVGYVVPHPGVIVGQAELREHLALKLPAYMVPGTVLQLATMPLNSNGKVDRKSLHTAVTIGGSDELVGSVPANAVPSGEWEERIAAVWRTVLEVDAVRRDDDFFKLGGDSMEAMRVMAVDPVVNVQDLYQYPVLHDLAEYLRSSDAALNGRITQSPEKP